MPVLHIQLLGDFRLTYDEEPLTAIVQARQQSLLAYLVLHRGAPLPRLYLACLFWPDTGEAQALTNLRNLLHKLRQVLPEPERFLQADTQTVQWRPDALYTLDVADFVSLTQSATQADLELAVNLYRGDLLPSCYDEWIVPERERLQHVMLGALEKLMSQAEAAHNYSAAVGYAQQLVQRDSLREETYRHLMRLHTLNHDRAAAMHVYHTCVTTLQRELGVEPSPPTRQAYEQLLNLEAQPLPPRVQAAVLPLVGRERDWTLLQSLWREAATWRPHLVLIKGEAGIGKTRLAEELIEWTSRQGFPALTAHCYSAQGQLAYAPLLEWLRTHPLHGLDEIWLTELTRLLPEITLEHPHLPKPTPLTQDWQRLRLFKALAHALLKDHLSLLLHLEDIQWCDRDTLDWLRYLLQSHLDASAQVRLLVIGSLRIEEMSPDHPLESLLAGLRRADQLTEIELGPLGESATFLLASRVAGRELDPALGPLLFQGSEGHPLFVVEMVRAGLAQMEPRGPDHARAMMQTVQALPLKVRRVIEARLRQLSPPAQDLVGLAATVGRAFTFDVLRRASSADEETLVRGLDELWQRRIVREQGADAYDFSHDKIREVAYAALSLARRRLLHRKVAEALAAVHGSDPDAVSGQIAMHYEQAALPDLAIRYYHRAAESARRVFANAEALDLLERAIALTARLPESEQCSPLTAQLHEAQGDVLGVIGRRAESRESFERTEASLASHEHVARARLLRKIGGSWVGQGQYEQALDGYDQAEAMLDSASHVPNPDWWQERIQLLLARLNWHYWMAQWQPMVVLAEQTRPLVEEHGTPLQQVEFYEVLRRVAFRRDRYLITEETLDYARIALTMAQQIGDAGKIADTQFGFGFALLWHGDFDCAAEMLQSALESAEQIGNTLLQVQSLTYLTVVERKRGCVEAVQMLAAESLAAAMSNQRGDYVALAKGNQAWLAWRAGRPDEARALGLAALDHISSLGTTHPFLWVILWPLIAVHLAEDSIATAVEYARKLLDPSQPRWPDELTQALQEAVAAWEQSEPQAARQHLWQAQAHAQKTGYL